MVTAAVERSRAAEEIQVLPPGLSEETVSSAHDETVEKERL